MHKSRIELASCIVTTISISAKDILVAPIIEDMIIVFTNATMNSTN